MRHFKCADLTGEQLDDEFARTLARLGKQMIAGTDASGGETMDSPANTAHGAETARTPVAWNIFTPQPEDRPTGEEIHLRAAKA